MLAPGNRLDVGASNSYFSARFSARHSRDRPHVPRMINPSPSRRSPHRPGLAYALVTLLCAALAGCQAALHAPPDMAIDKLLRPVTTSPDSVTLEIFEARIPLDENNRADAVWQQVDEQCFDADLRRRLLANGMRAGVVSGTLPDQLSSLLGLASEAPKETFEHVITPDSVVPRATRRLAQVNRTSPREIQATDVQSEAVVLFNDEGGPRGKTYRQVEGRYELWARSAPGQRVSVRLIPELHHGDLRNRYSGSDQGKLLIMPSREREAFERLAIETELAPGDLLVVGCLPQADSSLGGVLHTVTVKGRRERKFILVRACEAPPSEILANK